ncbi:MAG: hypothetical protein GY737_00120 [Desulfobacteraceae bacterium]|nr:hypothetical protein [Desulfobacteraceae bacterium]
MIPTALILILAGILLRIWGIVTLSEAGLTRHQIFIPQTPPTYTSKGPYRWLKHPLYIGALLWMTGLGILCLGWGGAVLGVPVWVTFYAERIILEEGMKREWEEKTSAS